MASTTSSIMNMIHSLSLLGTTAPGKEVAHYIKNLHPKAEVQKLMPGGTKVKDLMGDTKPLRTDNQKTMCLSFHI